MKRDYLSLIGLLFVAFMIFTAISAYGDIEVGGLRIKSSKLADVFTRQAPVTPVDTLTGDYDNLISIEPEPVVEPDTLPKTILIVGDSMLEGLYPRLAAYCEASGHTLYAVIWYSSTSEIWGRCNRLSDYIGQIEPDYIFISLGANELFVKDIADKRDRYVKNILSQVGDIPYVWIGPPNWRDDTGINALVASNVKPGCFFLTNGMRFNRKKDGAHPTAESAVVWMDSIVRWMPANAAYPLRLESPTKTRGKAKKVYMHSPQDTGL